MKKAPAWQPWEDEQVRVLPDAASIRSALPHRTKEAVRTRYRMLGRNFTRQDPWTPGEDAVVREHVGRPSAALKLLPHRTYEAVMTRAKNLGATRRTAPWTARQLKYLREKSLHQSDEKLGVMFGRSKIAVAAARHRQRALRPRTAPGTQAPLLQDIRSLAVDAGKSLKALKRHVSDASLFRERTKSGIAGNAASLVRAVKCTGGELYAEWED